MRRRSNCDNRRKYSIWVHDEHHRIKRVAQVRAEGALFAAECWLADNDAKVDSVVFVMRADKAWLFEVQKGSINGIPRLYAVAGA